jgi:hydrogenase nickel insertion protein HypA
MHEFALAQEIVATVSSKVTEGLENIQSIDIDVGAFSGVVVDSLDFGLQALLEEESITGIQININTIPTIAACECGMEYQLKEIFEMCPECQSFNRKLVSGTDIIIKSIELKENYTQNTPSPNEEDEIDLEYRHALATMAHEIKAPLSAIISMLSVIDKGYVTDPAKSRELVGRAKSKAGILMRMVNDILDYSMLSDKTLMKRERLDIYQVLKDSISMMKPYAQQRNISLIYKGTCRDERQVNGNYTFLLRVFNNLIMNAIKYNKERGKIEFTCLVTPQEDFFTIKVRDTGIGIPDEDLEHVFNIFERGKTARKNIDGSLGLGLSLVKQILEDHEGSIKISSTINVGTTVTVTLPIVN